MPKRKHHKIKIDELSAVDRPAQKGAVMNLMKRDNSLSEAIKKALDESAGNGEKAVIESIQSLLNKAASGGGDKSKGDEMPDDNKNADDKAAQELKDAKKSLSDTQSTLETAQADLKKAQALAEMTDTEKQFYKSLEGDKQEAFLGKSAADRASDVEMAKSADPVVYTSTDGEVFHKSDDPRVVAMAKRADASDKAMKKALDEQANTAFAKRAGDEMPNISGEDAAKVSFLKHMDGAPEDAKTFAKNMVKSLNDQNLKFGKSHGVRFTKDNSDGIEDAEDQLEARVNKYAKDNNVSTADAYSIVCAQEPELYAKAR